MATTYLDYNATTPLDAGVREAMLPFLGEIWGNPSSVHHVGRKARALLDDLRDRFSIVFKCKPSEIVFTSGGTEANNLAVFGTARMLKDKGRHLITSQIEHHAVLHCFDYLKAKEGFEVDRLPVDSAGRIDPNDLKSTLREDTVLVSLMAANNETGTIQPVEEFGSICREHGVLFHTDAIQWFGKQPFAEIDQFNADLVSICGHKFHGPRGAGALFVRSPLLPDPILFGGAHENERRAGTENLSSIAGLAEALERFVRAPVFERPELGNLTEKLIDRSKAIEGLTFRGDREKRLSNTSAFTVTGCDSIALLAGLDIEGICASSGSACSAGSIEPSHVMRAMGVSAEESNALLRFSFGRENCETDLDHLLEKLPEVIERVRNH
ncbi:MAG: cysteine desulfurase NifS [Verrucomicrobiales bacterium]|nr:cysteine desulfurase NifS [Verrucomicrobiales bacterium]|tara:strand:+ start:1950 stop:3095 length:1146 start_codon:yes stop_codon:yes gene_type:complete